MKTKNLPKWGFLEIKNEKKKYGFLITLLRVICYVNYSKRYDYLFISKVSRTV